VPKVGHSFQSLAQGADIVEADTRGPKVLLLPDGSYLKVFRRKRLLSSALWYPYARRFADNAGRLAARGIPCPQVLRVYSFPIIRAHVVHYLPLAGETLRHLIHSTADEATLHALRTQLGGFVAELHAKGIYFRSIHLGNVVRGDDGRLGLIDIADMRIGRSGLSRRLRKRNLAHLLRYKGDTDWLLADGGLSFAEAYVATGAQPLRPEEIRAVLVSTKPARH
jgi:tRNA A-37 threonylcarbamoyl transferase component Bud32